MVYCHSLFTIITTTISHSVKLPNGTNVLVTHIGTVQLTPSIILTEVLCVLSFKFYFIFAKKLAATLTYCLMFSFNFCLILDLLSWTTIEKGKVRNDLYYLLNTAISPSTLVIEIQPPTKHSIMASVTNFNIITDLWHCRIGHISFPVLHMITYPIVRDRISTINT